jgi:Tol biopolymer transport system component
MPMRGLSLIALMPLLVAAAGPAPADAPVPQLFAPDVISGPANDGAPSFTRDGATLFYEQSNGVWSTIVMSTRVKGAWTRPVLAPFADQYPSQQPAVSPDGRYVIFESTRPEPALGAGKKSAHLYRVDRIARGWGQPVELPHGVNIARRVFKPSIAANGDLYFMADVGGGSGAPAWRLYVSRRANGTYGQATQLAFSDGTYSDVDPYIAPDQHYLIFSSKNRPPFDDDHEHLFIAWRTAAGWSTPAAIRYAGDGGADDGEANVGPDGRTLYFTSGRTTAPKQGRTRAQVVADLARMQGWDNSNANVWMLTIDALRDRRAGTG